MNRRMRLQAGRPSGIAAFVALIVMWAIPASSQTVTNVHLSSASVQADAATIDTPVISDDGLWVAFSSPATNLVPADTGDEDIFVRGIATGTTLLLTPTMSECRRPSISADGRFVVFQAPGTNPAEVWRVDRDSDGNGIFDEAGGTATALVSVALGGGAANGASRSYEWAISNDGDRVAFESNATNLVAGGDPNGATEDCYVRIMSLALTVRVAGGNAGSGNPAISGDGGTVAWASSSTNLLLPPAADTNIAEDVFVRTLVVPAIGFPMLGAAQRVSVATGGGESNGFSAYPAISDAGVAIAFVSGATNLVPGDTNGTTDIFVHNVLTGVTTRVSVASGGGQSTGSGGIPAISGNGAVVSFFSTASDLWGPPGDQIYAYSFATQVTLRVSRAVDGTPANGFSQMSSVSGDGSSIAFTSDGTNLLGPGGDTNGVRDAFVRGGPFLGAGSDPLPPGGAGPDENPVTFSVDGPVDPSTEGLRDPRGIPPTPPFGPQAGDALAFCTRAPGVAAATGLPTFRPGDINDHLLAGVPSEPQMFQSAPPPPFPAAPPDGTDNQVLTAGATGLVAGPGVPGASWVGLPAGTAPAAPARDNIDAVSFGEDFFPPVITLGLNPMIPLAPPPVDFDGEFVAFMTPWSARVSLFDEPVVFATSAGMSLRFSVDPWAVGLPATAVLAESGGLDVGGACGPWGSPGAAAGDVFATPLLLRVGGFTVGGGTNVLVHDNPTMALAAPLMPAEDDIDALECVGDNDLPWFAAVPAMPGNLHARLMDVGPDLPIPGMASHDVVNSAPLFFSVTRSSTGAPGSAVRSQFVTDGGAAADIFVTAKAPGMPPGTGTNLLFIDESEIGLYAMDAPPVVGTSAADQTDDLDALILWVRPSLRMRISAVIDSLMATMPWTPIAPTGANIGPGMTQSIISMLKDEVMPGDIRVAFSVTTDAIGLEYTAVDFEAGPVFPPAGVSAAAGDVFYAEPDGEPVNPNYLFFEEMDLGLDPGVFVNGMPMGTPLSTISDNLDALDSIDQAYMPPRTYTPPTDVPERKAPKLLLLEPAVPNPFNPRTTLAYSLPREAPVRLTIHDVSGRQVAMLVDEVQSAGRHTVTWDGRSQSAVAMPSGIYFVKVAAAGEVRTRKIVMVK